MNSIKTFSALLSAGMMAFTISTAPAQTDYSATLAKVVQHSISVKNAEYAAAAQKEENHTGLNLDNPEVEFSYQWHTPDGIDNKKTIDITQPFDFATLNGAKKKLAKVKDALSECGIALSQRSVESDADALMTRIVYLNKEQALQDSTIRLLNRIINGAERMHKAGNITKVDVATLRTQLNEALTDSAMLAIEIKSAYYQLSILSGGEKIDWNGLAYLEYQLPTAMSQWNLDNNATNPTIMAANAQIEVAEKEILLRKAENLPKFSLGYTAELVPYDNFHGIAVGVEIPLWGNANRIKAARAAKAAAEIESENAVALLQMRRREIYDKALALQKLYEENLSLRNECDIKDGLEKLFMKGEISAQEYVVQLLPLIDLDRKVITTEYEYQSALAGFRALR